VVITYGGGYNGNLVNTKNIKAKKLTHLLYAFANVKNSRAYLVYPKTDDRNLRNLIRLKNINPQLKVLLSVGGLGWSHNFSDMAMTEPGRQIFAKSCIELIKKYDLDGIDIDWEFPGYPGEGGNIYRPEDKQNYTLMFKALHEQLNILQQNTGEHYLITTAVDGWASHFVPHTEMDKVAQYVDYVCLMTYNFNTPQLSGGHYLYSPPDWLPNGSADGAVKGFLAAGVSPGKLVLGAGFFPAEFVMNSSDTANRSYSSRPRFHGGLYRVYQMAGKNGYIKHWDEAGKAPYLFSAKERIKISYEDASSVTAKCNYIITNHLAGIMYWDYFSDPKRILLNTICRSFSTVKE
ncbi:MAG: glycoside hydrolase family 18 protein, partial [Mucilaginibacter sp.]